MQTIQERIEFLQAVVDSLEKMRDERAYSNESGICANFVKDLRLKGLYSEETEGFLSPCFSLWKHFQGNYTYPVEGSRDAHVSQYNKWDKNTYYGKLRYNLLEHCIRYFRKQLEEALTQGSE